MLSILLHYSVSVEFAAIADFGDNELIEIRAELVFWNDGDCSVVWEKECKGASAGEESIRPLGPLPMAERVEKV